MHDGDPAHILCHDLHLSRLGNMLAGECCIARCFPIQPHIQRTVKALSPSGLTMVCQDRLGITFPGKELIDPCHHRTGIVPHRQQASTRRWRTLYLRLTEVTPHRFFYIVPIDGEIYLKLLGTLRKAPGIVICQTPLPQIRRQGWVEMFRMIKVANRFSNVPPLKVDHTSLHVDIRITWVSLEVLR